MAKSARRCVVFVTILAIVGCGGSDGPKANDAGPPDAGLDGGRDAGSDAGRDAAPDGGGEDASPDDASPCEVDVDSDGFCGGPEGTDCDDEDPLTHPDAEETCDGSDRDCDGELDDGCPWYFGRPSPLVVLHPAAGVYSSPWLSGDGLSLYFVAGSELLVSVRPTIDDRFEPPQPVAGEDLASYCVGSVTLSADELEMFVQAAPVPECTAWDVHRTTRAAREEAFGPLVVLETIRDADPGVAEVDPDLSADGLELFFASDRGRGLQIWRARRDEVGGEFPVPEPVELLGDTEADATPFLLDDGLTIWFQRRVAGAQRIMRATRGVRGDLAFARPLEVVDLSVRGAADGDPFVSRSTRELFFTTDRPWSPTARALWRVQVCRDGPCVEPEVECPEGGIRSPDGRNCYTFDATRRTFDDAITACEAAEMHLPTVHSVYENVLVWNAAGGVASWLGAEDATVEGSHVWITGEPWTYSNWAGGEPNNCRDCGWAGCCEEDCVEITAGATWNDYDCALTRATACEIELWPWW